jgi:hypothetical protein
MAGLSFYLKCVVTLHNRCFFNLNDVVTLFNWSVSYFWQ